LIFSKNDTVAGNIFSNIATHEVDLWCNLSYMVLFKGALEICLQVRVGVWSRFEWGLVL